MAEAAIAAESTATLAAIPTGTLVPGWLGGINGCEPLSPDNLPALMAFRGTEPQITDLRDGWNTLPDADATRDRRINDGELAHQASDALACWGLQQQDAYGRQPDFLHPGHDTTFEKLNELGGVADAEMEAPGSRLELAWTPAQTDSRAIVDTLIDQANATDRADVLPLLVRPENLSQRLVMLSHQLNGAVRLLTNEAPGVLTPDQIFTAITWAIPLEGKWRDGIDPKLVDEIRQTCFTFRPTEGATYREEQPESTVRAQWDQLYGGQEIGLGQEVIDANGVHHFSNDGELAVAVRLVKDEEAEAVAIMLAEKRHYATIAKIGGGYSVLMMVFDMTNQDMNPEGTGVLNGSGGQLVPCGPGIVSLRTPTRAPGVPQLTEQPGVTPATPVVPRATGTPRPPIETTLPPPTATRVTTEAPPETPTTPPVPPTTEVPPATDTRVPPTSTERPTMTPPPTETLRPPTATVAPTQPLLPSETPGIPSITPNPHTPTPGVTEPATRLPTPTNPSATETPAVPMFEPFEPWELAAAKKAIQDYEMRRI